MMAFSFLITPGVIDSQTFQDHNPHTREVNQRAGLILFKITVFFFFTKQTLKSLNTGRSRPYTSQRQQRRLPPFPLVIALVPLERSSRNIQFPYRVPALYKREYSLVSLPFQKTKDTGQKKV